jgi:hypothetical protein
VSYDRRSGAGRAEQRDDLGQVLDEHEQQVDDDSDHGFPPFVGSGAAAGAAVS